MSIGPGRPGEIEPSGSPISRLSQPNENAFRDLKRISRFQEQSQNRTHTDLSHPTNLPNNSTRIAILKLDLTSRRTPRETLSVAFVFVTPLFGHFYE